MNKINWGIIGLGNIANKFAEGFESVDSASIKGVSSRQIGSGGTVIYHLVNGRSIKMKNTVNTDAVTLVVTSKTVPK